ncbi:MAG: DUF1549 and DUF1553 domain-containing protein [Gemmatales bacterium]|nr:DUF1549 and DUF1553 domain-containing protein [Gemmatales bacterium]MDW8388106.1 DUF1549 and DUF1553 domain-containing protein [Gemmatales bacterium]
MNTGKHSQSVGILGILIGFAFVGITPGQEPAEKGPSSAESAKVIASLIDRHIADKLREEKLDASPRCSDAEFARRVSLDIVGVIPTADAARAFLDSTDPNKRERLIDELLADPRYGQHLADIWQALLLPKVSDARRIQTQPFTEWLRDSFNENKPWDQMVTELLTATGSPEENGAAVYWLANQTVDMVTGSVSRLFLGMQLQCAQCHNHPFTGWKQEEYWGLAQFFMKVRFEGNPRQNGTAVVTESERGRRPMLPEGVKQVPPRFFQGEQPTLSRSEPYRPVFARWLTSPDNPFFAKAMVNRIWGQLFGRGLVHPVDDMRPDNPASHPELLDDLARHFIASGFDVKGLIRAICLSETYQRSSKPHGNNDSDATYFSHRTVTPLTPEQLYDSLQQVVGSPSAPPQRGGNPAAKNPNQANARAQFVAFFQADESGDPAEYQAGIPQALRLMNSPQLNRGGVLVEEAMRRHSTTEARVEHLFLGTLSRRPSEAELQRFGDHVRKSGSNERNGLNDVLWVLLNSSEFVLNR